jgi:glycosyltransferase involved in cell wall biosynthesis
MQTARKKIIAISTSPFPFGENITDGPGYRAWHLFQELANRHEIIVLSLYESFHLKLKNEYEISENNIRVKCIKHKPNKIADSIKCENPDILYTPWSSTPFLSRLTKKIPTIIDYVGTGLYETYAKQGYIPASLLQLKLKSFWFGDFLMTAGHRERYYLLGLLAASKKLTYGTHNTRVPLIHIIPMTPPPTPPELQEKIIDKKPEELILLVAGAFLPWYDYTTFFKALKILTQKGKNNFKVIFMGGNPRDPTFEKTIQKMAKTTLQEKLIITGLVPFKKRANYYLSADVAINIPSPTIEDELSVRTRIVDYLWARLPIITPARDEYSQIAVNNGAGFTYEAGNPLSLARTIETIMTKPEKLKQARTEIKKLLEAYFNLKNYIKPLELFIENPYVDPTRLSPRSITNELSLWVRDFLQLLK